MNKEIKTLKEKRSNISILGIPEEVNQENRAEQILKTNSEKFSWVLKKT